MPLFVVWSAQNSALIWKSVYEFFETRYPPLPLSATIAPSSALQLASPSGLKLSSPDVPSTSLVHPEPDHGIYEQPAAANAITSSPMRFISDLLLELTTAVPATATRDCPPCSRRSRRAPSCST